jgi:hypothetical protein
MRKLGHMCYWNKVLLPKHMCAGQRAQRTAYEIGPGWEDFIFNNLSESSETSVQLNPAHHASAAKDAQPKTP